MRPSMGFIEDFGGDGLVAFESVRDYGNIPTAKIPQLNKVRTWIIFDHFN